MMHHAASGTGGHLADCAPVDESRQHGQDEGVSCCTIGLGHCSNVWNSAADKPELPKLTGKQLLSGNPDLLQGLSPEVEPRPPRKSAV